MVEATAWLREDLLAMIESLDGMVDDCTPAGTLGARRAWSECPALHLPTAAISSGLSTAPRRRVQVEPPLSIDVGVVIRRAVIRRLENAGTNLMIGQVRKHAFSASRPAAT